MVHATETTMAMFVGGEFHRIACGTVGLDTGSTGVAYLANVVGESTSNYVAAMTGRRGGSMDRVFRWISRWNAHGLPRMTLTFSPPSLPTIAVASFAQSGCSAVRVTPVGANRNPPDPWFVAAAQYPLRPQIDQAQWSRVVAGGVEVISPAEADLLRAWCFGVVRGRNPPIDFEPI